MENQQETEQSFNICVICSSNNNYVRMKVLPCKNENCPESKQSRNDICNQCIRQIQRNIILCPFCNQAQVQTNSFGQYRNPFMKKFNIGLFSTKYLATKASKQLEDKSSVPIGSFNVLPIIVFNLINLSEENKEKQIKNKAKVILSHDKNVQALEVVAEDPTSSSFNSLPIEDQNEIKITKFCLDDLFRTSRSHLVRCGSNQIFISGGYVKDIDFLYGLKARDGRQIVFQDRLQDIWKSYSDGLFDQDQLIQGVQQVLKEYQDMQIRNQKMPPNCQLPFYYPYQNCCYLVNFGQQENIDFTITPQPYLNYNRAYHQTVITEDKIFVIGGMCNGLILDSIEYAEIKRDISSKIISVSQFQEISNLTEPRARFSAVYKPAVECTKQNCSAFSTKKSGELQCTNVNCANHQYIYIAGGQNIFGKIPETMSIERYNFKTNSCQTMNLSSTDATAQNLNQFNGMTLGVWKSDLFLFGGVPKSESAYQKFPQSLFVQLHPGSVIGFETIVEVQTISDSVNHCYQPEFTVSIPFLSENEEQKSISENYRAFIVYHRRGDNFYFDNYRIARNAKSNIVLSKCVQSENKSFSFVDKQWVEQGFFEEQNYCLLNSYIDY